jgi:hypothetical protein
MADPIVFSDAERAALTALIDGDMNRRHRSSEIQERLRQLRVIAANPHPTQSGAWMTGQPKRL